MGFKTDDMGRIAGVHGPRAQPAPVDVKMLMDMRRAAFAGGWKAAMAAMATGDGFSFEQRRDEWERHNTLPAIEAMRGGE